MRPSAIDGDERDVGVLGGERARAPTGARARDDTTWAARRPDPLPASRGERAAAEQAADRQLVRLGAARREDDLLGARADQARDLGARVLDRRARGPPRRVRARRIAGQRRAAPPPSRRPPRAARASSRCGRGRCSRGREYTRGRQRGSLTGGAVHQDAHRHAADEVLLDDAIQILHGHPVVEDARRTARRVPSSCTRMLGPRRQWPRQYLVDDAAPGPRGRAPRWSRPGAPPARPSRAVAAGRTAAHDDGQPARLAQSVNPGSPSWRDARVGLAQRPHEVRAQRRHRVRLLGDEQQQPAIAGAARA